MLCDYGCGQEANYTFKNGKHCCNKMTSMCPAQKKKNSEILKKDYKSGKRRKTTLPKKKCHFCGTLISINNIEKHEASCKMNNGKKCPVCGEPTKFGCVTCSRDCRLKYFGPPNVPDVKDLKHYRTICFRFHKKECVVCGEKHFIDVHHYDINHENNKPENLVPICVLHHRYIHHASLKYVVKECVAEYVEKFKRKMGL